MFFVSVIAFLLTIAGTVELALLSSSALLAYLLGSRTKSGRSRDEGGNLAVVIPAHDEEATIAEGIDSLKTSAGYSENVTIIVIADNCTDRTAEVAKARGLRVIERKDPKRVGKGFALDFAFRLLLKEGFDSFLIVDSDTVVEPNLISQVRGMFADGADAVQVRYLVRNPGSSWRARLMAWAFWAFNVLRPTGRDFLGMSAGILGNGFALRGEVLRRVPYSAQSIVEDLEYHLLLVQAGIRVRYVGATAVLGLVPGGARAAASQRKRWEAGRLRLVVAGVPTLVERVVRGNVLCVEPLLDLLTLPLGYHVMLVAIGLLASPPWLFPYWLGSVGVVGGHLVVAWLHGGGTARDWLSLAAVPLYLAWKVLRLPGTLAGAWRGVVWKRTNREPDP